MKTRELIYENEMRVNELENNFYRDKASNAECPACKENDLELRYGYMIWCKNCGVGQKEHYGSPKKAWDNWIRVYKAKDFEYHGM